MKWKVLFLLTPLLIFSIVCNNPVVAADDIYNSSNNYQNYYKGIVLNVIENGYKDIEGQKQPYQKIEVKILDSNLKDQIIQIENGGNFSIAEGQRVKKGEKIVVTQIGTPNGDLFIVSDKYRINSILLLCTFFVLIAIITAGKRGVTSLIGLFASVFIIINFIVPKILEGSNPTIVSYIGVVLIAVISLYLAHGFNKNTSLSLISTLITLVISIVLSVIAVNITKLTGAGTDESFFLQANQNLNINLKGLLLGGMILGVLGVLDDITTAQTSVISEIKSANPRLALFDLYSRGINVGKEHITSLINTLFLAYAGASLPLFLLFKINNNQPLWVTFNSEFIIEEVVRTLVGSIALILAVPLSTFIAAYYYNKKKISVRN